MKGIGKRIVGGLEKLTWGTAVGLSALAFSPKDTNAEVIIRTVPQQTNWIADGATEYRMDVIGNTTDPDVFDKNIVGSGWTAYVPDGIDFVRAELPDGVNNPSQNLNDFFFDHLMDSNFNRVDNTTSPNGVAGWQNILSDNVRITDNPFVGPMNVNDKILGTYFFTVAQGAQLGQTNFLMAGVNFTDSNLIQYNVISGLTIDNQPFNIVAPDTTPPIQSNHTPPTLSEIVTTSQAVSFVTDENGNCRWAVNDDLPYSAMVNIVNGEGTTSHNFTATGMNGGNGVVNVISIACQDTMGNADDSVSNTDLTYIVDTTAPIPTIISIGGDAVLPYSTSDNTPRVELSVDDPNAVYRADLNDVPHGAMAIECTGAGATRDCYFTTPISDNPSLEVFVSGVDSVGNEGRTFRNVEVDTQTPVQSGHDPANGSTIYTTEPVITFNTNESSDCLASLVDRGYDEMLPEDFDCAGDGTTNHICYTSGLLAGENHTVHISCRDDTDAFPNADTIQSNTHIDYFVDPQAIPTMGQWGYVITTLGMLTAGTLAFGRRREEGASE